MGAGLHFQQQEDDGAWSPPSTHQHQSPVRRLHTTRGRAEQQQRWMERFGEANEAEQQRCTRSSQGARTERLAPTKNSMGVVRTEDDFGRAIVERQRDHVKTNMQWVSRLSAHSKQTREAR